MAPTFNPNPPPKDPVRLSAALRTALIAHRHQTRQLYKDLAVAIGISPSMLSQLLHGKIVPKGDPRLAAIGQYVQGQGIDVMEWEEPA
jgi:transcriptional regulator with XRE-family HTH domain